jgi:hypothetical protein
MNDKSKGQEGSLKQSFSLEDLEGSLERDIDRGSIDYGNRPHTKRGPGTERGPGTDEGR